MQTENQIREMLKQRRQTDADTQQPPQGNYGDLADKGFQAHAAALNKMTDADIDRENALNRNGRSLTRYYRNRDGSVRVLH